MIVLTEEEFENIMLGYYSSELRDLRAHGGEEAVKVFLEHLKEYLRTREFREPFEYLFGGALDKTIKEASHGGN